MGLPNEIHPFHLAGAGAGYQISNSLRFRNSATGYMTRTFGTPTSTTKCTISFWMKIGSKIGVDNGIFVAWSGSSNTAFYIRKQSDETLNVFEYNSSTGTIWNAYTTAVFRDYSAWYHVVVSIDSGQATAANRVKIYVNGVQQTTTSTATITSLNYLNQNGITHFIGVEKNPSLVNAIDMYLAEFNFIDGQQIDPTYFGQTDIVTGIWGPKKYTGTYGNNGFYLPFNNTTGLLNLGVDNSGNNNNWIPYNFGTQYTQTVNTFSTVGTTTWTAPAGVTMVQYLVIAGGGGGGSGNISTGRTRAGGGGGAGGCRYGVMSVTAGSSYTITVGQGGAGSTNESNRGANGGISVFNTITSTGGGGGGCSQVEDGYAGGSGGGGANNPGIAGIGNLGGYNPSEGNRGGNGGASSGSTGGGGGGAGGAGTDGSSTGGVGLSLQITGSSVTYATGGDGGNGGSRGSQGSGYGGGGGGGGYNSNQTGSAGANGVVILSYVSGTSISSSVDTMIDSPTNYNDGSTYYNRGSYCTLSPLINLTSSGGGSLSEGNQKFTASGANYGVSPGTFLISSGKWYWEMYVSGYYNNIGVAAPADTIFTSSTHYVGATSTSYGLMVEFTGTIYAAYNNNSATNYSGWVAGDIVMVAYDADNGKIYFGKNNTWFNSGNPATGTNPVYSSIVGPVVPAAGAGAAANPAAVNFGQRPFAYTPPTGFLALNTYNLANPSLPLV